MLIAYFWLAFRSYKFLQTGWRVWVGNFIGIIAVYASSLLAASAIYNRAWEYVIPLEPHHGQARLSGAGPARIAEAWSDGYFYALLPDGRLWAGQTDRPRPDRAFKNLSGHFVSDSNWVDVAGSISHGAAALKSDGTLWRFSRRDGISQIGSDSDWKKVVAGQDLFVALKQNGTIWGWGVDELGVITDHPDQWGGPVIAEPVQLWPEADWADVFASGQPRAVKRDGSIWSWGYGDKPVKGGLTNSAVYRGLFRTELTGTNWSSLAGDDWMTMGVRTDGTLWLGLRQTYSNSWRAPAIFSSPIRQGGVLELGRIGTKSDWVGLAEGVFQFNALEADGTFWAIDRRSLQTKRPSRYHDWLAASANGSETWALAKDGTISCWSNVFPVGPDFRGGIDNEGKYPWFLLRPSRRPLASINILDAK